MLVFSLFAEYPASQVIALSEHKAITLCVPEVLRAPEITQLYQESVKQIKNTQLDCFTTTSWDPGFTTTSTEWTTTTYAPWTTTTGEPGEQSVLKYIFKIAYSRGSLIQNIMMIDVTRTVL